MGKIECSLPAYKRIMLTGLYEKILDKKKIIGSVFLYGDFYVDSPEVEVILKKSLENYLNPKRGISQKSEIDKEILLLEKELADSEGFSLDKTNLFFEYPSFLTKLILGEDLDYKKYGFPNLRELQKGIASFCIGNDYLFSYINRNYVWFNDKFKNEISLNMHGDFLVNQDYVYEPEEKEKTFFEENINFKSYKIDTPSGGISCDQNSSSFLLSVLKYAEFLGKEKMHEIVNWQNVLKEVGSVGTLTTECEFEKNTLNSSFMESEIFKEKEKNKNLPIFLPVQNEIISIPYISKENKLLYLVENNEVGSIDLKVGDKKIKFQKRLEFDSEDIPDLLKGTYRLFTRDKTILPQMMDYFINGVKSP